MPTDETPPAVHTPPQTVTDVNGRALRLGEFDPEIGAHVYQDIDGKPFIPLSAHKLTREELKAAKARATDPEALKPIRDQIRQEVEAQFAPRIIEAQLDGALYRHGFADDAETREEVLSRYSSVKPDAEGKRPSLAEWLKGQREANDGAGTRWLRSYLRDEAPPATKPPAKEPAAPPVTKPPPKSDPNGGASRTGAPPARSGGYSDAEIDAMSFDEVVKNLAGVKARYSPPK